MNFEHARRRHPRVQAGFLVKVHTGGRELVRKARDLSMTGLQLEVGDESLDERIVMEIPLPKEQRAVVVTGKVVREEAPDVAAVYFLDLDWDDMFALARYLAPRLP